jgi:hypothetical protein
MAEKITFVMGSPDPKKHSTRFDFSHSTSNTVDGTDPIDPKFKPSFYIPKPHFATAKRIRVTIEEVE